MNSINSLKVEDTTIDSIGDRRWIGGMLRIRELSKQNLKLVLTTYTGRVGAALVTGHILLAMLGPFLAPYSPTAQDLVNQLEAPSTEFWFGTDQFGRDLLSRVMYGARSIIVISVAGTLLGVTAGALVGMTSGYRGGRLDEIVMRVMDAQLSIPVLLLAMLIVAALGPNDINVVLVTAMAFLPAVARVMRSVTLTLKYRSYVESARLRGESNSYIIACEILPNAVPALVVEATVRLGYAVLLASSLGFLGLGVQPPSPDWGLMVSEGRAFISSAPWVPLVPAAAVTSLVVGVNLVVDGLAQARRSPTEGGRVR